MPPPIRSRRPRRCPRPICTPLLTSPTPAGEPRGFLSCVVGRARPSLAFQRMPLTGAIIARRHGRGDRAACIAVPPGTRRPRRAAAGIQTAAPPVASRMATRGRAGDPAAVRPADQQSSRTAAPHAAPGSPARARRERDERGITSHSQIRTRHDDWRATKQVTRRYGYRFAIGIIDRYAVTVTVHARVDLPRRTPPSAPAVLDHHAKAGPMWISMSTRASPRLTSGLRQELAQPPCLIAGQLVRVVDQREQLVA